MQLNNNFKTLGSQSANLIVTLYDRAQEIFAIADVCHITGLAEASARSMARSLVNRGLATRLKSGLFYLVPFQLGSEINFVGNPYVVASNLVKGGEYYISHASAMDIHGMLTQPQLIVYLSGLAVQRPLMIHGTEYRFVHVKQEHFFGRTEHWIEKQKKVWVSDLERTIIDGLKLPQYCGGFSEVAKGFWLRRSDIQIDKLVDYCLRLKINVVARRLGFLLELFNISAPMAVALLLSKVSRPYLLLDPLLPDEGYYQGRWKLRINLNPQEILSAIRN